MGAIAKTATPQEIETRLADDYLDTATLGRELAQEAMRLALAQARAGELRDPAKTAMNAIITSGTALDKRLVLQSRPTVIHASEDPKASAARLARRLGVSIDSTAEELEPTITPNLEPPEATIVPLLPEGAKPNARPRARRKAAD